MMYVFLQNNRSELIERCKRKVSMRPLHGTTSCQLEHGVPLFLDQLIKTLRIEQTSKPLESREVSGPAGGVLSMSEMGTSAAQHGAELLALGYTIDQVVHAYGDLCQAVTDLAFDRNSPFQVDEFRTLNRCLDNAIADAVTEYSYQRDTTADAQHLLLANQQAGIFVHEMRNALQMATFAFDAAKAESLSLCGATGSVLERSLVRLDNLIKRSSATVRASVESSLPFNLFSVSDFIREIENDETLAARAKGCEFHVSQVDKHLALRGNKDNLYIAVTNLVQNAFKFTHAHTIVTLDAYAVSDRILLDVKDHCGGLPAGSAERIFLPFTQHGSDKSGLGLGLSIARSNVEADDGTLSVADSPGTGCVFTVSLPRYAMSVH